MHDSRAAPSQQVEPWIYATYFQLQAALHLSLDGIVKNIKNICEVTGLFLLLSNNKNRRDNSPFQINDLRSLDKTGIAGNGSAAAFRVTCRARGESERAQVTPHRVALDISQVFYVAASKHRHRKKK